MSQHRAHHSGFDATLLASQSPPDLRLRGEMWKGAVPVVFHLATHEVTSMEDPPPMAMLVPRRSYFPLVLADVRNHFRDMTPAMEDELWLEFEGIPLKWHLPIGVLFDLLCPSSSSSDNAPTRLPWKLVVHFQSFPAKKLMRCRTLFTVRQHYLNTFKESCYLRFGSSRVAMACAPSDHAKLWDSLVNLKEDVYVAATTRIVQAGLMGGSVAPAGSQALALVQGALENRAVEDLAIRVYAHCTRASHEEGMNAEGHCTPIQRPVKPKTKQGQESTVADLVRQVLPTLIDPASLSDAEDPASAASFTLLPNVRLMVQGFVPPLSTPLSYLATYCSHPDGFLYFAAHIVEQPDEDQGADLFPLGVGMSYGGENGLGGTGAPRSSALAGVSGALLAATGFNPATLPGFHAASNAVNVVYQNLPAMPSMPVLPTSMSGLFGTASPAAAAASAAASPPAQAEPPAFSSASAIDSPPPADSAPLGDVDAMGDGEAPTQGRMLSAVEPGGEELP